MYTFTNKDVAKILDQISAAYTVTNDNYFKIIAYSRAAENIEHSTREVKDLWEEGQLKTIPGLGQGIQSNLDELFRTGKIKVLEAFKKRLPVGMFELLGITNMGPKTAFKLADQLKIRSREDLKQAAEAGRIRELPGFGEKSEQEILSSLAEVETRTDRVVLPFAFETAERFLKYLRSLKEVERAEPLGSLRRMVATIGDIDIAVSTKVPKKVIDHFTKYKEVSRVLDKGPRKSSVLLTNGMQVDLIVQGKKAFGALLQHLTGSKNHNIHLREYALKKNMSLSDYGIKKNDKLHEFETEEAFYKFIGMDYIEPELRENSGEVEAALKGNLPNLVSLKDVKGDIHLHSSFPIEPSHDLGAESMGEIVKVAIKYGYEYVGLSDHSPGASTHSKDQIVKLIEKRSNEIEQIKSSNIKIKVLNLLEIDILTNAELSVPEEGLKLLNGSIAGIHSNHRQDKETITKRLLVACESPYVTVISHPTGRLLNQRESYEVDWLKIFEACRKTKTILEINSWPNRLDLPDTLVKEAIAHGVKMIINTDSHAIYQMDNMKYGVSVARRGWAEKKDIINTLPWLEFSKYFRV